MQRDDDPTSLSSAPKLCRRETHHAFVYQSSIFLITNAEQPGQDRFAIAAEKWRQTAHRISGAVKTQRKAGLPLTTDMLALDFIMKRPRPQMRVLRHLIHPKQRRRRHAGRLKDLGGFRAIAGSGPARNLGLDLILNGPTCLKV